LIIDEKILLNAVYNETNVPQNTNNQIERINAQVTSSEISENKIFEELKTIVKEKYKTNPYNNNDHNNDDIILSLNTKHSSHNPYQVFI
jgi:hypothetical protein